MCADNANNPDGVTTADFGPDDEVVDGTAKDTETITAPKADDKSDEKPEPAGVSTTEPVETKEDAKPGPDEGKPEDVKPDEKPEDVAKARAYYQEKAQKETEARRALEDDLAAMTTELAAVDPSVDFDAGVAPDEAKPEVPAAPVADELADPTELDVAKLRKDLTGDVVGILDSREAKLRQHRIDVAYAKELKTVGDRFVTFVQKHKVPNEIAQAAITYSQRYVNEAALGAPTKRAELAGEYIQREMTNLAVKDRQKLAKEANAAADGDKVKAAQELAQPSGAGIIAPAPNTPESINKEHADDIMPDDPFS